MEDGWHAHRLPQQWGNTSSMPHQSSRGHCILHWSSHIIIAVIIVISVFFNLLDMCLKYSPRALCSQFYTSLGRLHVPIIGQYSVKLLAESGSLMVVGEPDYYLIILPPPLYDKLLTHISQGSYQTISVIDCEIETPYCQTHRSSLLKGFLAVINLAETDHLMTGCEIPTTSL